MPVPRPPMYQTHTPFVEFYINGVDILRSEDGKPRTLVSFTHQKISMTQGDWYLDVFDPNHIEIEELLLGIHGREGAGDSSATGTAGDYELFAPAVFRYGYVSSDGKVLVTSFEGEEYFCGNINSFVPTYQFNGTLLHIEGQTTGYLTPEIHKAKRAFYAKDIYAVIKEICELLNWTLVPLPVDPGVVELSPEKMPAPLTRTSGSVDTTEEAPETVRMFERETYYNFIKRLCNMARPNDPKYGTYDCYLESHSRTKTGEPVTYLYFGPMDVINTAPIRKYVYMRDPLSDVISYAPNINAFVGQVSGVVSGAVVKGDDKRLGLMIAHPLTPTNQDMKTLRLRRQVHASLTLPQMGQFQEGVPEHGEDTEKRAEGGSATGTVLASPKEGDMDAPSAEFSVHLTDAQLIDHASMMWWLGMNLYINSATLVIFGDPSSELSITSNILVVYYIPVENQQFRIHWTTQTWTIKGITHQISGGTYTTQLDLVSNSHPLSSVYSRQAWNALTDGMDENAMRRLGG